MSQFSVIIPAAGSSTRFEGFQQKKPFVDLQGRPVWLRTVDHFVNRNDVAEVVLVLAESDIESFRERFRADLMLLDLQIVKGGTTRAHSVLNGLNALTKPSDYVAVHDAARPLLTKKWITELFAAASEKQAVIPGTAVSSTVKKTDASGAIVQTVDRSQLFLAQTPQVFRRTLLQEAYAAAQDYASFTDEASIVEAYDHPVHVHPGWPMNIKITTREDFHLAEVLLPALPADDE